MNHRVLVLNQDYSPISVCSVQRAFLLVYLKKAEMINDVEALALRTVTRVFPMPAVVRLFAYVNIPYRSVELTRQNLFKRDSHSCQYCGVKRDLTIDHVVPRSKGGSSSWKNLVTACKKCNTQKGDFTPKEAGMDLKIKPFKPSYVLFLRDFSGFVMPEWKPYI